MELQLHISIAYRHTADFFQVFYDIDEMEKTWHTPINVIEYEVLMRIANSSCCFKFAIFSPTILRQKKLVLQG